MEVGMIDVNKYSINDTLVETRHYWIELLRIFLGALLLFRGVYFALNIGDIYTRVDEVFFVSGFVTSHYVITVHIVGGILIMIGLLTRLAIVFQIPVFIGAIFFLAGKDILFGLDTNLEFAILVLGLLIVFFFYGAGKWSVDHTLMRKKE
jgi:putative oxidoreductase